jgi:16S rRNA (cytidine1402-2'-O)-methyltransferase
MKVQKSFREIPERASYGVLYLVGTPIGNLEDITFRAIRILKEVQWIAAEDTRQTRKLLTHYEISTRVVSYHEHNKQASGTELVRRLMEGESVALVSDAGLPAISDPGSDLVKLAVDQNINVVPIPGANAALSALIVSDIDTSEFTFIGFLPKDKKILTHKLEQLQGRKESMIFYESPHRITKTLQSILDIWGNRQASMARELTKKYEEIARGSLNECLDWLQEQPAKGEYCIVVEGIPEMEKIQQDNMWWQELAIDEHMATYTEAGVDRKEAMKKVALDRKVPKREIYNKLI